MTYSALLQFGIPQVEADIYLLLLRLGPQRASFVAERIRLPRTTTQHHLEHLTSLGLTVTSRDKNAHIYAAAHPDMLANLADIRRREAQDEGEAQIRALRRLAPELASLMQGHHDIPHVRFFTGRSGVRDVLFDTLTSKTELLDYANIDAMFEHVRDINDDYVAAREKTSITKRSLLLDTPFARSVYESKRYSPKSHKGYKWIDAELYPFALEMNIYDNRISYITYVKGDFVGVIIHNEHIYRMHQSLWRALWDSLT